MLSVVNLNHETIINVIYPKVFKGIKDVVDDVVSEAAFALIPVVKQFVHHIDLVGTKNFVKMISRKFFLKV